MQANPATEPKRPRGRPAQEPGYTQVVNPRVSRETLEEMRRVAAEDGMPVATWMRSVCMKELARRRGDSK